MGAEGEYVQKLIPGFEKEYPGIKVKVQSLPWTAAQEKLITAYASDNLPDIFQLGNTWIPQFAALDALENLDEYINKSNNLNSDYYFEGIWNSNKIDGNLFGIPWYVDTRVLFYRKDVFEEAGYSSPPRNWNQLFDLSVKIKNIVGVEKYPVYIPTNEWAPFIIFGLQNNATLLKQNNTRGNFSSENFVKAFSFLIDFHKKNLAPIGISQVNNIYQAFAEKYISMYISGPWNIKEFKKQMTSENSDKWMTAPLPAVDSNYPGTSLAGGASLVINKNSENKTAAWKLIEYLSRVEVQVEFYKYVNSLPARKESWKDSTLANDVYLVAFHEQLKNVTATPKIPEWEQIVFSKLQQYAEFTAREVMTVEEAMKVLDKDVDLILEKRRWLLSR